MWLLVGGESEIGAAAHRHLTAQGRAIALTTRRPSHESNARPLFDLSAPLDRWEPPRGTDAACIFAGVGRLAACAADPAGSAHINVMQTIALVERLLKREIYVLFLSTNLVFDGSRPCMPADAATSPVSEYGRQKARVEAALRTHMRRGAPVATLRLAKILSRETTLIRGWVDALSQGKPMRAFGDMRLAPASVDVVGEAIAVLLRDRSPGIFQLAGPRDVSYAEAGRHLARKLGADPGLVETVDASSAGVPEGATPRHTTLDSTLMRERYGVAVPDVWDVIEGLFLSAGGTAAPHDCV
jgi:dTDP-4-dehydrorhamnose reductase